MLVYMTGVEKARGREGQTVAGEGREVVKDWAGQGLMT